jgi:hypothetical protein
MSRFIGILCTAAVVTGLGSMVTPKASAGDWGPAVDSPAPDFTLVDQRGRSHSLDSLLGQRALAIVFYRSADW